MFNAASSSRRLLLLGAVTTMVPLVCLGWLASRVMQDDRERQERPTGVRLDRAADLAADALEKLLSIAEYQLGGLGYSPQSESLGPLVDGLAFVIVKQQGLGPGRDAFGHTGAKPFYLPSGYESQGFIDRWFGEEWHQFEGIKRAQGMEDRGDLSGALEILQPLLAVKSSRVRANALFRVGRIHRNAGNLEEALQAYSALKALGHTTVDTRPAMLAGALGRAAVYEATGQHEELQNEAAEIHHGLVNCRWTLTRDAFQDAYDDVRQWLVVKPPALDAEKLALSEALDHLWQDAKRKWLTAGIERAREIVWVNNVPVLVVSQYSPGRVRAAFITPRYLERVWRSGLRATMQGDDIDIVLTDRNDRPLLGLLSGPVSRRSVRSGTASQQPWKVHAVSSRDGAPLLPSLQTQVVLSGLAILGLLSVAGTYVISRAMLRELRAAKMQSEFVAAVSHEFRTPLTTLRQLAEMLVKGRISSEERRQLFYDTLLRESERMQRLVEGLLNFGSMEAGELQYRFGVIELEPFIRDIVADFEQSIEGRGYAVEVVSSLQSTPVRADRDLLARVFWNLLDNAVKYSPDERTIRVELTSEDGRAAVSVRDRGVGIAPAEQKTIFDKFVRGRAARATGVQGTGVGLAMVRRIVTAHDGDISLVSQPGHGSVFTVLLPIATP